MKTIVKNYEMRTQSGRNVKIETRRYDVYGFDIILSVEGLFEGANAQESKNLKYGYVLHADVDNKRQILPISKELYDSITDDRKATTDESRVRDEKLRSEKAERMERQAKERNYDNIYNEGGEGYNPYRNGDAPTYKPRRQDNTPYYKLDF